MRWFELTLIIAICLTRISEGGIPLVKDFDNTDNFDCLRIGGCKSHRNGAIVKREINAESKTDKEAESISYQLTDEDIEVEGLNETDHHVTKRSVCKPNQEFQSECNTCKCSADGLTYTCTQNECMEKGVDREVEVFMENEGTDHIERHSVCKPEGTFYIGCNTCRCNYDGTDYSCTNKPCPLPDDVELFHELKVVKSSNDSKAIICVANRMFIKDCNTCWCNEDGTSFVCTRKVCIPDFSEDGADDKPEDLRVIQKECRPYEVFEVDCNTCRCNPDGKSFSCTRRACAEPSEDEKKHLSVRDVHVTPSDLPKACQPGQEFRIDCNHCLCDYAGQDFSCTRMDCNKRESRRKRDTSLTVVMECAPSSIFHKECNVCRCAESGKQATCTNRRCKLNNTQISSTTEDAVGFRCSPGQRFKRSCNDCFCSADGKEVFCTLILCDEDYQPDA